MSATDAAEPGDVWWRGGKVSVPSKTGGVWRIDSYNRGIPVKNGPGLRRRKTETLLYTIVARARVDQPDAWLESTWQVGNVMSFSWRSEPKRPQYW